MTQTPNRDVQHLLAALAAELATFVGGATDAPIDITEAETAAEAAWLVRLSVRGPLAGRVVIALDADGARTLSALGTPGAPAGEAPGADASSADASGDGDLAGPLAGFWRRVLGELAGRPGLEDLTVSVEACEPSDGSGPGASVSWQALTLGDETVSVGFAADLHAVARDAAPQAAALPPSALPSNLDVVLDIDLPLSVRFGRTEMTLATLSRLGPGSVIELDRAPEDPVEILVNGKLVARGDVVVVTGNYGVRITEVMSAADRIRSLGA